MEEYAAGTGDHTGDHHIVLPNPFTLRERERERERESDEESEEEEEEEDGAREVEGSSVGEGDLVLPKSRKRLAQKKDVVALRI